MSRRSKVERSGAISSIVTFDTAGSSNLTPMRRKRLREGVNSSHMGVMATTALCEVADKMLAVPEFYVSSFAWAALAFLVCCAHRLAVVAVLPAAILYCLVHCALLVEDDVLPAVVREVGWSYVAHTGIASVLPMIAAIAGCVVGVRGRGTSRASLGVL